MSLQGRSHPYPRLQGRLGFRGAWVQGGAFGKHHFEASFFPCGLRLSHPSGHALRGRESEWAACV